MNTQPPKKSDGLESYFNKGAAVVQDYRARLENYDIHSVHKSAETHFHEQPIVFTFVVTFALLSLIPVVFFVCVSALIIIALCATGLTCALLASAGIILVLLGFLVVVLIGTLLTSVFLTATFISSYYFLRLIRREVSPGMPDWSKETTHTPLYRPSHGDKEPKIASGTNESSISIDGRSGNCPDKDSGVNEEKLGELNNYSRRPEYD